MKSNTKKRLIAFMLCMVLVLSSTISAFADEPQNTDSQSQAGGDQYCGCPARGRLVQVAANGLRLLPSGCHISKARCVTLGSGCSTERWLDPWRQFQSPCRDGGGFFIAGWPKVKSIPFSTG